MNYQIEYNQQVTRIPHDMNIVGASDTFKSVTITSAAGNQSDRDLRIAPSTSYTPLVDNVYEVSLTADSTSGTISYKWRKNKGAYTIVVGATTPDTLTDGIDIEWGSIGNFKSGDTWIIQGTYGRPQILAAINDGNTIFVSMAGSDAGGAGAGGTFAAPKRTIEGARVRAAALAFTQIAIKDSGVYPELINPFTTPMSIEALQGFKPTIQSSFNGLNTASTAVNTIYVAKSFGADIDGNGSESTPFATLSFAVKSQRSNITHLVILDDEDYTNEGVIDLLYIKTTTTPQRTLNLSSKYMPKIRGVKYQTLSSEFPVISGIHFIGNGIAGSDIGINIISDGVIPLTAWIATIRYCIFENLSVGISGGVGGAVAINLSINNNIFRNLVLGITFDDPTVQFDAGSAIAITNNYFYKCGLSTNIANSLGINIGIAKTTAVALNVNITLTHNTFHDCVNFRAIFIEMNETGLNNLTVGIGVQDCIFYNVSQAIICAENGGTITSYLGNDAIAPVTPDYRNNMFWNVNVFSAGFDITTDNGFNTFNTVDPKLFTYSVIPGADSASYNGGVTVATDKGVDAQQFAILRSSLNDSVISAYGIIFENLYPFPFVQAIRTGRVANGVIQSRFCKFIGFECALIGNNTTAFSELQNLEFKNCNIGINVNRSRTSGASVRAETLIWNENLGVCGVYITTGNNLAFTHLTIYGYLRGLITFTNAIPVDASIFQNNKIDISLNGAFTLSIIKTRLSNIELFGGALTANTNISNLSIIFNDTVAGDFRLRSRFGGYEIESPLLYYSDTGITYNAITHFSDIGAYLQARTIMQDRWITFTLFQPFDAPQYSQTPAESSNNINRNGLNRVHSRGRKEIIEFIWDVMKEVSLDNIKAMFKAEYSKENFGKIRIYFFPETDKSFEVYKLDMTKDIQFKKRVNRFALKYHDGVSISVREYKE